METVPFLSSGFACIYIDWHLYPGCRPLKLVCNQGSHTDFFLNRCDEDSFCIHSQRGFEPSHVNVWSQEEAAVTWDIVLWGVMPPWSHLTQVYIKLHTPTPGLDQTGIGLNLLQVCLDLA